MTQPTPSPTTPDTEAKLRAKLVSIAGALELLASIAPVNRAEGEAVAFMLGLLADFCGGEVGQ